MKRKFTIIIISICTILFLLVNYFQVATAKTNESNTVVAGYLEKPLEAGKNTVYSSAFQLAYNELANEIIQEKIRIRGCLELCYFMNKHLDEKPNIKDSDYVAIAGYNRDDIVKKIQEELNKKFKDDTPIVDINLKRPDDILAYSYIRKIVEFKSKFEEIEEGVAFNNEKVKAFGLNSFKDNLKDALNLKEQVKLYNYKDENDFIVKLKDKNREEEIILAKVKPGITLYETAKKVIEDLENNEPEDIEDGDILKIPMINFSIEHNFKEMEEKMILNKNFEEYYIDKAIETIDFSLDESGAKLEAEGKIVSKKIGLNIGRKLIFDKPFLIIMRESNESKYKSLKKPPKSPYFVMWIENNEFMQKK